VASGTWTAAQLVESSSTAVATAAGSVVASINGSQAAVAWLQTTDLYVARFDGTSWSSATLVESSANAAAQPSIANDAQGNVTVLLQQSDGTVASIYVNRYAIGGAPYYTIPAGASWQSIANTL
jgi:hypothetical protein